MRNAHTYLIGKGERNRKLDRPRRKWEHNIKTDLNSVRDCGMD
jgi:hypothetical protein